MHNEIDSYKDCKDLQNLLNITLNDVIKPLRNALKKNPSSKIIALEIRDAENKAFEYIASQITAIGNADEKVSAKCLKEFPKSDVCYRCIGLDDDTIEGLIRIRGLSFLSFLELEYIVCQQLLFKYTLNEECVSKILQACETIKRNVDIIYSDSSLNDDTRNLIKLVTRLVDNKFTLDDIDIIGIPDWNEIQDDGKCDNNDKSNHSNHVNCNNIYIDCNNQYDHKLIHDIHPSNINSTKMPINKDDLVKVIQSNEERNYLNANYNLNSLSVPNTPNVQKSRSVGGSEEILADLTPTNEKEIELIYNSSPLTNHKNNMNNKVAYITSPNSLQRSHSHEFEYKNHLTDKDINKNNTVFQFNTEKSHLDMERRSSYEEKSLQKNVTNDLVVFDPVNSPNHIKSCEVNNNKGNTHHKFESDTKFTLTMIKSAICSVCKIKKFMPKLLYCENCKIKVHKACVSLASEIPCSGSPMTERKNSQNFDATNTNNIQGSDSNSASSCNSSPASPFNLESGYNSGVNNHISPRHPNKRFPHQKFEFSVIDETDTVKQNSEELEETPKNENSITLNHIDRSVHRLESTESQDDFSRLSRTNSISVALKEWEIPLENLELRELLGKGSFSTVLKGKWHGEVAVKIMTIDSQDESDSCMSAFKSEVAALHKTRHENLVLFMGACMKPPTLAIVTQLSQGETLYHQLHSKHTNFTTIRAITIASQVAKGMGYLHAKEILHKDLKSRNIFIENNTKAVISDFGLFDFVRMCKQARSGSYLRIPHGWLCYLSPELIKKLNFNFVFSTNIANEDLPFTKASDIFAFGTIWYEILNSKWPYEGLPSEAIIYKVGKGVKETLKSSHSREFKDLLLMCWACKPESRPHFTNIVQLLEKLPKLQRSPSYPVKSVTVGRNHDNLMN